MSNSRDLALHLFSLLRENQSTPVPVNDWDEKSPYVSTIGEVRILTVRRKATEYDFNIVTSDNRRYRVIVASEDA